MIAVYRIGSSENIFVSCTKVERVDVEKIKGIIRTLNKIGKTINKPCNIVVKSIEDVCFTKTGEKYFLKLCKSEIIANSKATLIYERIIPE